MYYDIRLIYGIVVYVEISHTKSCPINALICSVEKCPSNVKYFKKWLSYSQFRNQR